ncbi:hypothetical protein [Streptomyces noursei]|uniref:hypothetical protein n=1 Tax=Streptomyces noursei TaxID=1971 RepID=UPI003811893C
MEIPAAGAVVALLVLALAGCGSRTTARRCGCPRGPEDLAHISPHLTEHINRFGEYSTHELGIQPDAYDPKLDVDFAPLHEQDLTAAGLGQAACSKPGW